MQSILFWTKEKLQNIKLFLFDRQRLYDLVWCTYEILLNILEIIYFDRDKGDENYYEDILRCAFKSEEESSMKTTKKFDFLT